MFKKIFVVLLLIFFTYAGCENKSSSKKIVKDEQTNLMWQDDYEARSVEKNWDDARKYCANLTLGGYDDWRLPSIEELRSIVDYGSHEPAINASFKNVANDIYWSSTSYAGDSSSACVILFSSGGVDRFSKSDTWFVRCVKDKR